MGSFRTKRTVLVPIFGGDVSEETLGVTRSLMAGAGSQLVLLHVTPLEGAAGSATPRTCGDTEPRWRRLASGIAPNRTFVEAVIGDPATEVLAQAERFHSDVIVLTPAPVGAANAWIDRAIARLLSAAPRDVYVATGRASSRRTTPVAHPKARRALSPRRSHAAQPRVRLTPRAAHW